MLPSGNMGRRKRERNYSPPRKYSTAGFTEGGQHPKATLEQESL
jgi:hypothetical protein